MWALTVTDDAEDVVDDDDDDVPLEWLTTTVLGLGDGEVLLMEFIDSNSSPSVGDVAMFALVVALNSSKSKSSYINSFSSKSGS